MEKQNFVSVFTARIPVGDGRGMNGANFSAIVKRSSNGRAESNDQPEQRNYATDIYLLFMDYGSSPFEILANISNPLCCLGVIFVVWFLGWASPD
jgi:hypothetical protein